MICFPLVLPWRLAPSWYTSLAQDRQCQSSVHRSSSSPHSVHPLGGGLPVALWLHLHRNFPRSLGMLAMLTKESPVASFEQTAIAWSILAPKKLWRPCYQRPSSNQACSAQWSTLETKRQSRLSWIESRGTCTTARSPNSGRRFVESQPASIHWACTRCTLKRDKFCIAGAVLWRFQVVIDSYRTWFTFFDISKIRCFNMSPTQQHQAAPHHWHAVVRSTHCFEAFLVRWLFWEGDPQAATRSCFCSGLLACACSLWQPCANHLLDLLVRKLDKD